MGGGKGAARVPSAIVQSADNGRATLWDSVLVSLSISVLCVAVFVCVCIISNFPFSTFFSDFLLFSRFRSFFRLAKLSLCALLHADRRL